MKNTHTLIFTQPQSRQHRSARHHQSQLGLGMDVAWSVFATMERTIPDWHISTVHCTCSVYTTYSTYVMYMYTQCNEHYK